MIRTISDDKLRTLAHRAAERSNETGDYWDRAAAFLSDLRPRRDLTKREHNWLSQLRQDLTEVGD